MLVAWDYRQKWSWYANRAYLSPPAYHVLNGKLLGIVGRLADEPLLAEQACRWNPETLSGVDRLEIYCGFLLTKNWNRVRPGHGNKPSQAFEGSRRPLGKANHHRALRRLEARADPRSFWPRKPTGRWVVHVLTGARGRLHLSSDPATQATPSSCRVNALSFHHRSRGLR